VSGQLTFDLPVRTALGREAFSISSSNARAAAQIDDWANWPKRKLVLHGPSGAGKTHLARVWSSMTDATVVSARELTDQSLQVRDGTRIVVEDVPEIGANAPAQVALFHLHNELEATGGWLLMTGIGAPVSWPLGLPDLASRVQACAVAQLFPPDDALLSHVLVKLFQDRQLSPRPKVVAWLVRHMERSFSEASRVVDEMDRRGLAEKRKLSIGLASEVVKGT